jgi:hypothetical protein
MITRSLPTLFLIYLPLLGVAAPVAAECDPDGEVAFVCGPVNPEDLIALPDSPWVVVSGMEDEGHLYVADRRDHTASVAFPTAHPAARHDTAAFPSCPGPAPGGFQAHGLGLRPGQDGTHTLYVVRHGAREAVEVFTVDATGTLPTFRWVGCVPAPDGVRLNSVAALPGGGFAATNFNLPRGEVWEWQADAGWAKVPGSETPAPNGLVVSPDGRWLFIGGWATKSLIRLSRGQTPQAKDAVDVGFYVDNVRWSPDGSLLVAGHSAESPAAVFDCMLNGACSGVTTRVAGVHPQELTVHDLVSYPSNDRLILGTVAISVGNEIWVGGIGGGDRIARFPVPTP